MTMSSLLRSWITQQMPARTTRDRQPPRRRRAAARRLFTEPLEGRTLLSLTYGWSQTMEVNTEPSPYHDSWARDVATDSAGNVYITGHFSGTADFDPRNVRQDGSDILTSRGDFQEDIFVAKYGAGGDLAWVQSFGSANEDNSEFGTGIAVGDDAHVYVTGHFVGNDADFGRLANGQPVTLSTRGDHWRGDAFVLKLSPDGDTVWARSMGSNDANDSDSGEGIAVDGAGNVYTTGWFVGSADFGGVSRTSAGGRDGFVTKHRPDGSLAWVRQIGGSSSDHGYGVAVSGAGDVYVTGAFNGRITLATSPTKITLNDKTGRGFITRLDTNGDFLWATNFEHRGADVTVGGDGSVYLSGTGGWGSEILAAKLTPTGQFTWKKTVRGGSNSALAQGIAMDSADNVYVTGRFWGTQDFDPGPGEFLLSSQGDGDIFVLQLDTDGNFGLAARMGGSRMATGQGIAVTGSGEIYVTGLIDGQVDLDPTDGVDLHDSQWRRMFLTKLTNQHGDIPPSEPGLPTIGSLTTNPNTVNPGEPFTLTAADVSGPVERVEFYRDTNNNGILDAGDLLLGHDADGSNGWSWTVSVAAGTPAGTYSYLAVAVDATNNTSAPAATAVTVVEVSPAGTKFFVVDDGASDFTFGYDTHGGPQSSTAVPGPSPRGITSLADGSRSWVVDANGTVTVYDAQGTRVGSWAAGGLSRPEGIATNGSDIWIVDQATRCVFRYRNAVSLLSGSASPNANFALAAENAAATGITTDGSSLWVVDDGASADSVFRYAANNGKLQGSWTITWTNARPTGITIDFGDPGALWVVDAQTLRAYRFAGATGRTSGSQAPTSSFALATGNANPQGIADPVPGGTAADAPPTAPARLRTLGRASRASLAVAVPRPNVPEAWRAARPSTLLSMRATSPARPAPTITFAVESEASAPTVGDWVRQLARRPRRWHS